MTLSDYYDRLAVARVVIPRCPRRVDKEGSGQEGLRTIAYGSIDEGG